MALNSSGLAPMPPITGAALKATMPVCRKSQKGSAAISRYSGSVRDKGAEAGRRMARRLHGQGLAEADRQPVPAVDHTDRERQVDPLALGEFGTQGVVVGIGRVLG